MSDPFTNAWAEAQASVPKNIVEIMCIELLHPGFIDGDGNPVAIRAVNDTQDHAFMLESTAVLNASQSVTFTAIPFSIQWPEVEDGRIPELTVKIDNIGREVSPYLDIAVVIQAPVTLTLRVYLVDTVAQTSTAAIDPIVFDLRSVTVSETAVEGKASPADLANMRALQLVYDMENYPGLELVSA